jgi:pimeloyl-ACP methyl ester carboxylesterase
MVPAGTHIEANGLRIYHEVHGAGEPLLLIHGGTATSQAWASHLPAFTEHFRTGRFVRYLGGRRDDA